jgi:hypothetical protein
VILPFAPTAEAWTIESPEGSAVIWFPSPGIAAAQLRGVATGEVARRGYELIDLQTEVPLLGFLDMYETTGFEWEARGRALKWNILHLSPKMMLHILVRTPPLVLAMTVFRRALEGHVEIHTDQGAFASAYHLTLRRRTRSGSNFPPARRA